MADETTAKPDDKAKTTDTPPTPEDGVTIRSTDAADAAPAVELTETDEERATREATEAQSTNVAGKTDEGGQDDDEGDEGDETDSAGETGETETGTEEERSAKAAAGDDKTKPKRRRPRAQERINDALREKYRSDARAAAFQQENEELKAAAAEKPKAATGTDKKDDTPDEKAPPRPAQDDFDTFEEFLRADARWEAKEAVREERQGIRDEILDQIKADRDKEAADEQLQVEQNAVATYSQRIDETRAAHPDFDEVIEKSGDVPISPPMKEALIATPLAGDILYHFAKNPVLCAEIAEMPASQALVAMGRLEAQLEAEAGGAPGAQATTTTARPKRRLPKPVTPVGTSAAVTTVPLDKMPYPQYKAEMERRERVAAGR